MAFCSRKGRLTSPKAISWPTRRNLINHGESSLMNFLGIYREPEYSPGRHTSNDAKILRLAGQALERYGVSVQLATLEEARGLWKQADLIFSMCQGPAAVAELTQWKK